MQAKRGRGNFSKFNKSGNFSKFNKSGNFRNSKDRQFSNVKDKKFRNSNYDQSYNKRGRHFGNSGDKHFDNRKGKHFGDFGDSNYFDEKDFGDSNYFDEKNFGDSNYFDEKDKEFQNYGEGNFTPPGEETKNSRYLTSLYSLFKDASGGDKHILAGRIFDEIQKEYIQKHCCNRFVSQILDETLYLASYDTLFAFITAFSEDLWLFATDPFASHALQALLTLSLKYIQKEIDGKSPEQLPLSKQKEKFNAFLVQVSKFVYNNLDVFVCHTYATFIVRTILEVCSGVLISKSIGSSKKKKYLQTHLDSQQVLEIPEDLQELLPNIAHRLLKLKDFSEVISSRQGSSVMQAILSVLSAKGNTELISVIVDHIGEVGFGPMNIYMNESTMHPLFENDCTSLLMEVIISSVPQKQLKSIWDQYFVKNLDTISCGKPSNFSLQKILLYWNSKADFPEIYHAIAAFLQDILATQMTGVILELVKACRRLGSCQNECLKDLKKLLNFSSNTNQPQESFILMLLYLTPLKMFAEKQKTNEMSYTLHGSLILQELMNFNYTKEIAQDFLSLTPLKLIQISCDWKACHVIKAFMSSDINYSTKEKFYDKLKGNLVKLACDKYGSRSLEDMWDVLDIDTRTNICEELVKSKSMLAEHTFGQIIMNNFELESFMKGSKSWENVQQKKVGKRKHLAEMLSKIESQPQKKRKKTDSKKKGKNKMKKGH